MTLAVAALALATWLAPSPGPTSSSTSTSTPSPTAVVNANLPATNAEEPTRRPLPPLESFHISVPRLDIDLPLAYGDVTRDVPRPGFAGNTPERVALVFPGSAPLASGGNTYVYAHARAGMFLSLWNVRVGDDVIVYVPGQSDVLLRYSVVTVLPRVDPTDTSWLDPRGPERVTLQTSTGPNPSDPRFIAVAVPIDRPTPTAIP